MKDEVLTEKQLAIIEEYCCDDMKKLKRVCSPIVSLIGGISRKDHDDIYSLAQFLLYKCVKKYDENNEKGASFNTFFRNILNRRLGATYLRDRNRQCRSNTKEGENGAKIFISDVSLDAPTPDCVSTLERISVSATLEEEIFKPDISKETKEYLHSLSSEQLEIAKLFMEGYQQDDIKDILHITQTEFNDRMNGMKSYRNISIYFKKIKR